MNAAYALGEAGTDAAGGVADHVGELLDDPLDAVVRTAIDALCSLTCFGAATVGRLHRRLVANVAGWEEPAMGSHWTIGNQVRYVAALALTARTATADVPAGVEEALVSALDDETGYVPAVACRGLERLATETALLLSLLIKSKDGLDQRLLSGASASRLGGPHPCERRTFVAALPHARCELPHP